MSELINNRANRIQTLKQIIQHLHAGGSEDEVREQMRTLVKETDHTEVVAMEHELMASGMPVEEIRSMCDLHARVVSEVIVPFPPPKLAPGHPLDTFRRENEALRESMAKLRTALPEGGSAPSFEFHQAFNELMDIEKHYQRKEHALFSKLEKHGIHGPSKVMWAKDDEVRAKLKALGEALHTTAHGAAPEQANPLDVAALALAALRGIEEMMMKEEQILFPMSADTLTEEDWGEIWLASPRYGWCLVEPRKGYQPPAQVVQKGLEIDAKQGIHLPTGNLTLQQLMGIFETLPVDITFVDADDRVAFFSEGPDRVFARSRAIIGRKVQNCHPPKSVDTVDRILSDFRAGTQNVAEFWIEFHGRFVHIRYFAVRDEDRHYLGTLEITQDLTRLRALQGERRLLEYSAA